MGAGLSKKSKQHSQYPWGIPPYPTPYPPGNQPYMPSYGPAGGYGHTVFPQNQMMPQPGTGFIPPGAYGQGANLPPQLLSWLPQDRRRKPKRKSRRSQSDRFVGGFAGEGPPPAQSTRVEQPRRTRSESHHRPNPDAPVIPAGIQRSSTRRRSEDPGPRRMPTPFIPAFGQEEEEEEDYRRTQPAPDLHRTTSRNSEVRFPSPHVVDGTLENVLDPMEPASRAAFGPTGDRPRTPLRNPLPPPPRDLYEMTPYKSLLTLPQTTALLTATYGPQQLTTGLSLNPAGDQPGVKRHKSVKGLLRAFSKREKHKQPEPTKTQFIPIFVGKDQQPQAGNALYRTVSQQSHFTMNGPPVMPAPHVTGGMPIPQVPQSNVMQPQPPVTMPVPEVTNFTNSQTPRNPDVNPVPPVPSNPPPVLIDQENEYSAFLNHSYNRILYRNKIYASALHLHEAMKFLENHPDIAEQIRLCGDVHNVYPLSANFQQLQRPDWYRVFINFMDDVLLLKFRQHPDLRTKLLNTGTRDIIYNDPGESFWGNGPDGLGENQFGKALVRVRNVLRAEGL